MQIIYTVLDAIDVPDNWTEEEIYVAVSDNANDRDIWGMVDDIEWEVIRRGSKEIDGGRIK